MTEAEKRGLTAFALLAGTFPPPPPSNPTSGAGNSGKPIDQADIQLELSEFDP